MPYIELNGRHGDLKPIAAYKSAANAERMKFGSIQRSDTTQNTGKTWALRAIYKEAVLKHKEDIMIFYSDTRQLVETFGTVPQGSSMQYSVLLQPDFMNNMRVKIAMVAADRPVMIFIDDDYTYGDIDTKALFDFVSLISTFQNVFVYIAGDLMSHYI